jgi:hypothetical protein
MRFHLLYYKTATSNQSTGINIEAVTMEEALVIFRRDVKEYHTVLYVANEEIFNMLFGKRDLPDLS